MLGMTHHTSTRSFIRLTAATFAAGSLLLAAGCGDDETAATTTAAATTAAATETSAAPAEAITFTGQWARTSPSMATMGAAYVTITSPADDVLLDVSGDASIAKTVQIHEMVMAESTATTMAMGGASTSMAMGGSDTTMAMGTGEMVMREVDHIDLPAGTAVALKPGGYHIMLIDLVKPLAVGTTIQITLVFEKAGSVTIDVPVLDEAP